MRKRLLGCSLLGLLIVIIAGLLFLDAGRMQYTCLTQSKAEKLMSHLRQSENPLTFSLCFREQPLAVNEADRTFFLPVDSGDSLWEPGAFSATQETEIFFLEDFCREEKKSLVAGNTAIPFLAVQNDFYEICYLKLTGLPVISFAGTDRLYEDGNPLYEFTLYEAAGGQDWVTKCLTTATVRGNTSKEYEKKSLRLRLKKEKKDGSIVKNNENLLQIREDDDWILNSLYADNTRIRDKLCMELWQQTGAYSNPYGQNFGMTGEYAEVFINGGYAGLYLLTHPIDRKQLGMEAVSAQIARGEEVVERIYKKKYTAVWRESDFTGAYPDPGLKDYRGGFFLKGDTILENEEEWEPLRRMAACIEAEDEVFSVTVGQLADPENIADNWLFFQAVGGFDNENKNVYYITRNRGGRSYGYFIPWDMNLSFGAVYADNAYYAEETMDEVETPVAFEPGMRMISLDAQESRSYVQQTWKKWREGAFATQAVLARIDALHSSITDSGALAREIERWPDGNASADLTLMREFTERRLAFVDAYVEGLVQ